MNTSRKGKLFGIFNILDIIIILFIIAAVAGVIFKSNMLDVIRSGSNDDNIEFKVRISGVRDFTCDALEVGDKIYDSETGAELGVITNKEVSEFMTRIDQLDGTIILTPSPILKNVVITVEGKGTSRDDGYFINGNRLVAPNGGLGIITEKVETNGIILSSRKVN